MAHLYETRNFDVDLSGASYLGRVVCIGDSMMYGQGVLPRHTLPAHLSGTINAAYPDKLIWVDNHGQSSGNIWNAWEPFRQFADRNRVDVVVFSICQNDSQVFDSNTVRYHGSEKLQYWLPGTPYRKLVERTLSEVEAFCGSRNIVPVVLFYSFVSSDEPIIEILSEICAERGIELLDMLSHFREDSGISVREYSASPFDGHPSSLAHGLCARHLTRIIMETRAFTDRPVIADTTVSESVVQACRDIGVEGATGTHVLFWAQEVLEAKARRLRRMRRSGSGIELGDVDAARNDIATLYAQWRMQTVRKVGVSAADREIAEHLIEPLVKVHANVRNLSELAYCAEVADDADMVGDLSNLLATSEFYKGEGRLRPIVREWPDNLRKRRDQAADIAGQVRELAQRTSPDTTGAGYLRSLSELAEMTGKYCGRIAEQAERRLAEILSIEKPVYWQVCEYATATAINQQTSLLRELSALDASDLGHVAPVEDLPGAVHAEGVHGMHGEDLYTRITVVLEGGKVEGEPRGACNLLVEVDYAAPARIRHRDKLWAGVEAERFVYIFEVPLLLSGDITVGDPDWDPMRVRFLNGATRLESVEVRHVDPGRDTADAPIVLLWKAETNEHRARITFRRISHGAESEPATVKDTG